MEPTQDKTVATKNVSSHMFAQQLLALPDRMLAIVDENGLVSLPMNPTEWQIESCGDIIMVSITKSKQLTLANRDD